MITIDTEKSTTTDIHFTIKIKKTHSLKIAIKKWNL